MGRTRLRIWAPIAAVCAVVIAVAARPLAIGWECYRLHATGERAATEVVATEAPKQLVLRILDGPRAGTHCTSTTSAAHRARLAPGDRLEVVLPEARTDECVLVATLENSAWLLGSVGALVGMILAMAVAAGVFLQRTFTRRLPPTTRFDLAGDPACPRCDAPMAEGYVPLVAGLHWRDSGEPVGLPHALAGLPGTVGWRGRPRLHAWRCPKCEILTLQYGDGGRRSS